MALTCALLLASSHAHASQALPESFRDDWLALLHYRPDSGVWTSEVHDRSFFLAPRGRMSPFREWQADQRAFLQRVDAAGADEHAQCRFPARFDLMARALGWSSTDVPRARCPSFEAFRRRVAAKSLSAVFVSHYLSNPASAFGHTMLYLGSERDDRAVLVDHSVSFEADTQGMSPVGYIPRGLAGGLVASFRVAPLHERVRKYERREQRDLWLFPLRIEEHELEQLVRHLWELQDIEFEYGFFGGNCAQKILAVVHAVAPRHGLLPFGGAAVLPSEVVVRLVERMGLASEPMHRPSLSSRYSRQVAELSARERRQHKRMIATRTVVAGASAAALSATLLWSELNTPHRAFQSPADAKAHPDLVWRRALWRARVAATPADATRATSAPSPASMPPSILSSHGPSRVRLRGGYRDSSGATVGLGVRWLLHEGVDPAAGYPPLSTMEVARIDADVSVDGDIYVDEITAIRVQRFAPSSPLQSALAWKLELGARRLPAPDSRPLHVGAEVGLGAGFALGASRPWSLSAYAMLGIRPGATVDGDGAAFLGAGIASGGLLLRVPADIRVHVRGEYARSLTTYESLDEGALGASGILRKGLSKNWDVEVAGAIAPDAVSVAFGLVLFR